MKLIDADALKELFSEVIGSIAKKPEMNGNLEHMIRASAMVIQMIDDAPSAQPDIIRCKDCKHYKFGICMKIGANKSFYGFCDWAERREDATD